MTLADLIDIIKHEKPSTFSSEKLVEKVNEVESILQEFLEVPQLDRVRYVWLSSNDDKLIAPEPYSRLYVSYLKAAIDLVNEEYESYANNQSQFELDYENWTAFIVRTGKKGAKPYRIKGWW